MRLSGLLMIFSFILLTVLPTHAEGLRPPNAKPLDSSAVALWKEDLRYLQSMLEQRHFDLYHSQPKAVFDRRVDQIIARLPELNPYELTVELMGLARSVGDGHTIIGWWGRPSAQYPIRFDVFEEQYRVVTTLPGHTQWTGYRLVGIDDHNLDDILSKLEPIVPLGSENRYSLKARMNITLSISDVLYGLGITKQLDRATYRLMDDKGDVHEVKVSAVPSEDVDPNLIDMPMQTFDGKVKYSTTGIDFYLNESGKTAYFDYNTYPSFEEMYTFAEDVRQELEEKKTRNVIIDLRGNTGGNFFVGLVLAQELVVIDTLDWKKGVYILTDNMTFSAATSNAALFRQILNARIVGEPTGGNAYGIQDADMLHLPNSNWPVMYSKRLFRLQDVPTEGVQPDQWVLKRWEDVKRGYDAPLQWIMNEIHKRMGT